MRKSLQTWNLWLTLAVVGALAMPGHARESDEEDESLRILVTGEEINRYVEPNATTGTRTDTPLRDVPQSIQVIPQEVLEDQQVIRLNDALRNVSGVVPSGNDPRGQRFNVRGFNDTAQLRDGFRISGIGGQNIGFQELANVEQIEVLKGPASILFGAVEPGGVINLVSEQPLREPFYELGFRAGNRGLIEPSLDFSGPLTEDGRLLYRLNALYRNENSFRDFDTDIERFFIAPTISWQISDRTDLTLSLEYSDDERPTDFGLVADGDGVLDVPFDRNLGEPEDRLTAEFLRTGYRFEHRFSDNWKIRNGFNYINYDEQFTSAGLNLTGGVVGPNGELFRNFQAFGSQQDIYELQTNVVGEFTTGSIEHTLLAGIDLFRRDVEDDPLQVDFTPLPPLNVFDPVYNQTARPDFDALPSVFENETRTDFLGVYLQDQVSFSDNLKLLAGFRYEAFEQKTTSSSTFFPITSPETRQTGDAFSPRIGLVYQPVEDVSLFASYSRSFSPNTGTTIDGDILEPEEGEQFEVGVKAELLEDLLSINLAYFDITLQNVQTVDPNNLFSSVATGEERSQGVELDVIGKILPGWNLVANYAYIDARIIEDNTGLEGNRRFNVPNHNFNVWTTYDIQDGPLTGLGFGLGFNFVDERFGDNANSYELDSYFLTNAAMSYRRDNWRAGLNIRNLFDVDYIESTPGNRLAVYPGEEFTITGSFSIEF
ncbi:MAG: TonB-dependent siderophore receptor [Cyanobacteria bacterium P01_H01_bin.21]